ncbi:hypothetical protein ACFE04_028058 [Oxalis oulophora]
MQGATGSWPKCKLCDVCGVTGLTHLLVSCSKCPTVRHSYCVPVYKEKIPKYWICEDCKEEARLLNSANYTSHSRRNGNSSKGKAGMSLEEFNKARFKNSEKGCEK